MEQVQQKVLLSKSLESVNRDLDEVEETAESYTDVLIATDNELQAITGLEALAINLNLAQQLQAASPRQTSDKLVNYLPLTITLAGDFDNLWRYIGELERLPFTTNVQRMTVTPIPPSSTGELSGIVTATLTVWLFLQA